jgi:hypothetical protein
MSSFRVRPRFVQTVPLSPQQIEDRVSAALAERCRGCELKRFPGYLTLRIPEDEQHFWSPQLTLSLDPDEAGGTTISGIYGPRTNVWSMFLYGYLIVGTLATFTGIFGIAQWVVGARPWGLAPFAIFVALALALYLFAQFGQKLGARQTYTLHLAYEAAIGESVEIR